VIDSSLPREPNRFCDGCGLFQKDLPAAEVLQNLWPQTLIAFPTLSAATWLFRRRLG